MAIVKFVKSKMIPGQGCYAAGEVAGFNDTTTAMLLKEGAAVIYDENAKPKPAVDEVPPAPTVTKPAKVPKTKGAKAKAEK